MIASRKSFFEQPELAKFALVGAFVNHPCPYTLSQYHEVLDLIGLPTEAAWRIAQLLILSYYSPAQKLKPDTTNAVKPDIETAAPSPSGQEPNMLLHGRVRYLRTITESVSASIYKTEARKALLDIANLLIVLNQQEPRWVSFLSQKEKGSFREAGTDLVMFLGVMIERWLTDPKGFMTIDWTNESTS